MKYQSYDKADRAASVSIKNGSNYVIKKLRGMVCLFALQQEVLLIISQFMVQF